VCRTSGPLTEGPGSTSSPGSLPAPRVACRCSPVGFDRQHTPSTSPSQGVCRTSGPLTEGPGPTSTPGSLPAPRVACRCSLVSFDRQHILARPVGHHQLLPSTTSTTIDCIIFFGYIDLSCQDAEREPDYL
jgi:hypothetical protein